MQCSVIFKKISLVTRLLVFNHVFQDYVKFLYMAAVVMAVALELKHIVETYPIRVSQHCISCYITVTVIQTAILE